MATTKDTIVKNYKRGLWTEDMLAKLVLKGKLSAMDYAEIVGNAMDLTALTEQQIQKYFEDAIEAYMTSVVQTRNYRDIHTAASYVNSTNEKFAKEGAACNKWRDDVWNKCYEILGEVKSGFRPIPTLEEVIAELPLLDWGVE